ncbi:hypothetical protein ACQ4PT_003023 [Festuca glaucescens]
MPAQPYSTLSVNSTLTSSPGETCNGEGLQAASSRDLALLKGAPRNGELTLTTPTDHQQETVANMRKDRNQARRERDRARRNSLTDEQKEEKNARRRAARQKKTIDERNAYQRQARKNVPTKRDKR